MRNALALIAALALTAITVVVAGPVQARDRLPDIPEEMGVRSPLNGILIPYRCTNGPVYNFYHGAYYDQPPAVFLDYAYRPYYRYTANRVLPRTYYCSDRYRR